MNGITCVLLIPALACLGLAAPALAGTGSDLEIRVRGPAGGGVLDAVVEAHRAEPAGPAPDPRRARMDQIGRRFVPHVMAVQRGTTVEFPNSDQIRHSIYSFSAAKVFEIRLYRGIEAPPIRFDEAGLVVLGCNIHDYMLGYLYVLETPHFGVTDERGAVRLRDLAAGEWRVQVRHPRLAEDQVVLERRVRLPASEGLELVLGRAPPPRPASLEPVEDALQDLFERGR